MKNVMFVFFLFFSFYYLGQKIDGPINVPKNVVKKISFSDNLGNPKIFNDSINDKTYKCYINSSEDFSVDMKVILDSLKDKNHFIILIYTESNELVFKFSGNYEKGNYSKYYPSGILYGKGKIVNGRHYGVYKQYSSNGDLAVKCFYENGHVKLKWRRFYRKLETGEIISDKKWYQKETKARNMFSGSPHYYLLDFSEITR